MHAGLPWVTSLLVAGILSSGSDPAVKDLEREVAAALEARDPEALGRTFSRAAVLDSGAAAELILEAYVRVESVPGTVYYAEDRYEIYSAASRALVQFKNPGALEALQRAALRHRKPEARFLILTAAFAHPGLNAVPLSVEVLRRDSSPLVVRRAVTNLALSRSKDGVRPLIDLMAELEHALGMAPKTEKPPEHGPRRLGRLKGTEETEWTRTWLAARDALERLIGRSFTFSDEYRSFWQAHGKKVDPGKVPPGKRSERTAVLFGLELTGKNMAFVIDVSGSMVAIDPRRSGGPRTEVVKGPGGIDFPDFRRQRIYRAKEQLKRVLRALGDDRRFNIIAFSSNVDPWKAGLVPATRKNQEAAIKYVDGLRADGVTVTDAALEAAFADPLVDTIFLLTDGAPTHEGTTGPGLPPDSLDIIKRIHGRVEALNYRRQVRIFTFGFAGAKEDFLIKLARENQGTYVPIR